MCLLSWVLTSDGQSSQVFGKDVQLSVWGRGQVMGGVQEQRSCQGWGQGRLEKDGSQYDHLGVVQVEWETLCRYGKLALEIKHNSIFSEQVMGEVSDNSDSTQKSH